MNAPLPDLAALPAALAAHLRGIAAAPAPLGRFPGLSLLPHDSSLAPGQAELLVARLAERYQAAIENRAAVAERLAALRAELAQRGLQGLIIPLTDEFHGEYLPLRAQRLTWLTGFTGSAGLCIVLPERAGLWSDGRYTLQLRQQVDATLFELLHITDQPPTEWLKTALKPGDKLGYDAWLHTEDALRRFAAVAQAAKAEAVAVEGNPIDAVWSDQPPPPLAPVVPHGMAHAGRASSEKRAEIAARLAQDGIDAVLITLPESIAWLLNIRGGDVKHTPFALSMALLRRDASLDLFIDTRKLAPETPAHLGPDVRLHAPDALAAALDALGKAKQTVQVDPATAGAWPIRRLEAAGAVLKRADDPCLLPKACKNAVELDGIRNAHLRDGAAVSRFLAWLAREAPKGGIDELQAQAQLEACRRLDNSLRDLSFTSISGAGPNGAVVHYRATEETNRKLETGNLYLIDSGGQYPDGTTDITRTIAIGTPTQEMREAFTRVLKGHIAIARARFPDGTAGQQLDALARYALWQAGLDYDHGTGHGVGAYLSVHEGPHRISKAGTPVPLKPGMIVSNEPGYYKTGAFGIRIENLVAVRQEVEKAENGKAWHGFETLTKAPIDRNLIETALLTREEIDWVNAYHAEVRRDIGPRVDDDTRRWLESATAAV
jgi:Xaa-Pro aminopeptidase